MKQRTEAVRTAEGVTLPTLVGIDYNTEWISAYMVSKKGFDKYALFCVVRDIEQSGYNRMILKSDQENSMTDIINAVKREGAEDIDVMTEKSPVGEHQSNGEVERAIQSVQELMRVMKLALQSRYKSRIRGDHPILPWLVRHAAIVVTL